MIVLPHSDTLTFPTDTESQTAPSDTKSSSQSDKSQNMMSSAADSRNLRQDRSQPTTQEGKAFRHGAFNEREGTRSQTSSQEPTPHQDLETHMRQDDGAPSIQAEQRWSSSEDKQRDGATRNQAPPPSEIRNSRKESSVRKKQGNPPSGTATASQSTVPQSQDQREPQEIKQGHSTARDFDEDGHQTQDRTSTRRGRGAEWDRDGGGGGRVRDRDESAAADEPSNTKKDATSHRL